MITFIRRLQRALADRPSDPLEARDSVWKMIGEFFRELGVLIIAFYPIEGDFRKSRYGMLLIVLCGIICLMVGILLERRRKS